jgi:hypothetical protein
MAIEFQCDNCDSSLKVPDNSAGKRVKCPQCQVIQTIPIPRQPPIAEPPKKVRTLPSPKAPATAPSTPAPLQAKPVQASPQTKSTQPSPQSRPAQATPQAKPAKAPLQTKPAEVILLQPIESPATLSGLDNFLEEELTAGPPVKVDKPAWETAAPAPQPAPVVRGYSPQPSRGKDSSRSRGILKIPAVILLLFSGLGMVGCVGYFSLKIMVLVNSNVPLDTLLSEPRIVSTLAGELIGVLIGLIIQITIFRASLAMISSSNHSLAKAGAILACIPCFCPLGFPFAIWALILLSSKSMKRNFDD